MKRIVLSIALVAMRRLVHFSILLLWFLASMIYAQTQRASSSYLDRADRSYAKGEFRRAIEDYTVAITFNPNFAQAYVNRGIARVAQNEIDAAMGDYNRAIEINPTLAVAFTARSAARFMKGDFDGSIADSNRAIQLNPREAWAYNNRGNAFCKKGQIDSALADFEKAITLNPRLAEVFCNRAVVYWSKGDFDASMEDAQRALAADPRFARAYLIRGAAWNLKKQFDKAIAEFSKAIELNPQLALAYYNRANSHRDKGELEAAIADYDMTVALAPGLAEAYANRGFARLLQGRTAIADADFASALKLNPGLKPDIERRAKQTRQQFSEAELQLLEQQLDQTIAAAPPEFFAHSGREFDQFMSRYVSLLPPNARLDAYTRVNAVVEKLGKNAAVRIFTADPRFPRQIAFGRDGKVFLLDQALTVLTDEELTALLAHELAHDQRDTNRRSVIAASGDSLGEWLQYNLLLRIEQRADEAAMSLLQQRRQNPDTLIKLLRHMIDLNVLSKEEAQGRLQAASTALPRIVAESK